MNNLRMAAVLLVTAVSPLAHAADIGQCITDIEFVQDALTPTYSEMGICTNPMELHNKPGQGERICDSMAKKLSDAIEKLEAYQVRNSDRKLEGAIKKLADFQTILDHLLEKKLIDYTDDYVVINQRLSDAKTCLPPIS